MTAAALLLAAFAAAPDGPAASLDALVQAWRARADGAAVATQVIVHEGQAESTASAEPCVLAWQPDGPALAMRRGGLVVAIADGRIRASHERTEAAMDQEVRDQALTAWRAAFAEMPWPQPAMLLLPADRLLTGMDPEIGPLEVRSVDAEGDDRVVTLKGDRGSWMLRFRGDAPVRLVEATRRIDAGPRVPKDAWIEWRMRFEHAEPESGIFRPAVEGKSRVDRLASVMPSAAPAPPRADPGRGGHEVEATPEQRGDSIAPKP